MRSTSRNASPGRAFFTRARQRPASSGTGACIEQLEARQLLSGGASEVTEYSLPINLTVASMANGPDGNLWFTYYTQGSVGIGRMSTSGFASYFPTGAANYHLANLVVGPDENLWFTETGSNGASALVRVSTTGQFSTFADPDNGGPLVSGPDGKLWVGGGYLDNSTSTATETAVIDRIDPASGQAVSRWVMPQGTRPPGQMFMGKDGDVWFEEPYAIFDHGYHIDGIDLGGNLLFRTPLDFGGGGGVGIAPSGALWDCESIQPFVEAFAPNGSPLLLELAKSPQYQYAFGSPGDGLAYVGGASPNEISAFDPTALTPGGYGPYPYLFWDTAQASFPTGGPVSNLITGSDGNLWFSTSPYVTSDGTQHPAGIGQLLVQRVRMSLTDNATGAVNPGDKIHFTLNYTAGPDLPTNSVVTVYLPAGTTYVPGSSTAATDLGNGQLQFNFTGQQSAQVTFDVTVNDQNHLPLEAPMVTATADASATFPDGRSTRFQATDTLNMGTVSHLDVTVTPHPATPGQVAPGESFTVDLYAVARTGSDVKVSFDTPADTTMTWSNPFDPTSGKPIAGIGFENVSIARGTVTLTVNSSGPLPSDGVLTLIANASATLPSGQVVTGSNTVTLRIVSPISVTVTSSKATAHAGDVITYTIAATAQSQASAWSIEDAIPQGMDYVPGSASNGGQLGANAQGTPDVQWTLPPGSSATVSFAVKVENLAQMNGGITGFNDIANIAAMVNGSPVTGVGSAVAALARPYLITGLVRDVALNYPATDVIDVPPLAGVTVQLLKSDGNAVLQIATTDALGQYQFSITDPGSYFVRVLHPVDLFNSAGDTMSSAAFVTQPLQPVMVPVSLKVPITMVDEFLPVTLINKASAQFQALNHFPMPVLGGPMGLAPISFRFDTSAGERVVAGLVVNSPVFDPADLTAGIGTASPWIALARSVGIMDGITQTFMPNLRLVDDFAKNLALLATSYMLKKLTPRGTPLSQLENPAQLNAIEQKLAQVDRVHFLTGVFGSLKGVFGLLDNKTAQKWGIDKALIYEVLAVAERLATGFFPNVGKLRDDLLFEAAFDTIRYGLTVAMMSTFYGASVSIPWIDRLLYGGNPGRAKSLTRMGFQETLDTTFKAVQDAGYSPQSDTTIVLQNINRATANAVDAANAEHDFASNFSYYLSLGRAAQNSNGVTQGILEADSTQVGPLRQAFHEILGQAAFLFGAVPITTAYVWQEDTLCNAMADQLNAVSQMVQNAFTIN